MSVKCVEFSQDIENIFGIQGKRDEYCTYWEIRALETILAMLSSLISRVGHFDNFGVKKFLINKLLQKKIKSFSTLKWEKSSTLSHVISLQSSFLDKFLFVVSLLIVKGLKHFFRAKKEEDENVCVNLWEILMKVRAKNKC